MSPLSTSFEVHVQKEDFKFHAAHFVAFEGYRERLHGHNYKVGVRLLGSRQVAHDGYVVDFGDIKKATRKVCKKLNEHFLCPTLSNVLDINVVEDENAAGGGSVSISCQDGTSFSFPRNDCAMLPIVHATAEELAVYLWSQILDGLDAGYLVKRGVHTMEVIVAEAVGQQAIFRLEIPTEDGKVSSLNVADFVSAGPTPNSGCPSAPSTADQAHDSTPACCQACQKSFSLHLQKLADALNHDADGAIDKLKAGGSVTVDSIQALIRNEKR